ncbi:thiol reductant ABC exporter subunit CydC [Halomonas saccharevitans]|uniref:Thiol reductant ABC exporter subunit CydC n=1 Tax=Halomonas saccharevitans TaxID=416872 RepID=A0ABU3NCW0_9GAMM|nr:thiol reductant ABC exporter subunit CydC [Halomonas saccharevitans]MDT8878021.1 thiol reductant ABC exporter subunit CydC [Halomonas saccharevitans]
MPDAREASLITTLRPWWRLLDRRRGRLLVGACLMLLTVAAGIGLLALSGWFITATALTGLALAAGLSAFLDVYVPGGGIRFFAVTRTVSRYVERLYNHDTVLRLLADLRGHLFGVMVGLDGRTLSRRRASDWLDRLTADIDTLDGLYLRLVAPAGVALLAILALSGLLALWLPRAGLVALALLLSAWLWLTLGQARRGMAASRGQVEALEALRGRMLEHLRGLAELEAYGSLATHRARLEAIERRLQVDQWRLARVAALGSALAGLAVGATWLAVLVLAALAWQAGALSGPVMVLMPLAVMALNEALAALPMAFTRLGATRAAAERLNALEAARCPSAAVSCETSAAGQAPHPGPLDVTLDAVDLHYPGALQPALTALDLSLPAGQRLALCGASGAGKSSVAQLLTRQLAPSAGRITLGGVPVEAIDEATLRQRVACLTQQVELFDDSLAANLRLGDSEADEARLWRVLSMVELAGWADALPEGLETRVGEGGRRLSGGQARRVGLARLLLREPDLVILDEPFAGLDAPTAARLAARLDGWLAGRSVIYLVHQLGEAVDPPGIDQRLTLREGALCTDGQDVSG